MSKYYVKYWLRNLRRYYTMDHLSLQEAQIIHEKLKRQGVNAKIEKHKNP